MDGDRRADVPGCHGRAGAGFRVQGISQDMTALWHRTAHH